MPVVADSVYVTFDTELAEWVDGALRSADQARDELGPTGRVTVGSPGWWSVRRGQLEGRTAYEYIATGLGDWHGVRVLIGSRHRDRPTVRSCCLILGSDLLWMEAGRGRSAARVVRDVLDGLANTETAFGLLAKAPESDRVLPTRIDLCVDHWGYEWRMPDLRRFATRSKWRMWAVDEVGDAEVVDVEEGWCYTGPTGSTLYLGKRGKTTRMLRVYDKTAEAAKSDKLRWLEPLWAQHGWTRGTNVWRAEVEFGGQWLRKHGMRSLVEMEHAERELWHHYTAEVRHVRGETDQLRHEGPSHVWTAMMRATDTMPIRAAWKWEPRPESVGIDMDALAKQGAGIGLTIAEGLFGGAAELVPKSQRVGFDGQRQQTIEQQLDRALVMMRATALAKVAREVRTWRPGDPEPTRIAPVHLVDDPDDEPAEREPRNARIAAMIEEAHERGAELAAEFEAAHLERQRYLAEQP